MELTGNLPRRSGEAAKADRVALVHDWLNGMRGGEKVLEALCEQYPDADIFTLFHVPGSVSPAIERHRIITSGLQKLPFSRTRYRALLPLYPTAIEQFDLDAYDLVISSSHCAAKAAVAPGRARHICYCHSPMRYAWDQFDAYFGPERVGAFASRWLYAPVLGRLARWDAATAPRVGRFVANSHHVAGRIRRYYNREATIVYPPVDTSFYHPDTTPPGQHFLIVSALVPYKRIDVAIDACRRAGASLRIVGDGPDRARLERHANGSATTPGGSPSTSLGTSRVEFIGRATNDEIRDEYRRALAVLLPGEEDFGIVPVEAQACGRPVVAFARGGALETVIPGDTGILFDELSPASLAAALERAAATRFDVDRLRANAERFSHERHVEKMRAVVEETLDHPAGTTW
ncbi:MAG TPA: glycosyltransferase [Vicinamibacterales bacterium]|nr:glycosyltransferase [Vicinamibacterales bacterium]